MTQSDFTITHQQLKLCDLYQMHGRIDGATAPQFEEALYKGLDSGRYRIVLNLSHVDYMSSAALRVLIAATKESRRLKRGDIRLAAVNERIMQVLDLAGLDVLFQMYNTEVEAVDSFA